MKPDAKNHSKQQKNEINSVKKSSTEIKLDNQKYHDNIEVTKLPDSNFKEVSDDSNSEEEEIGSYEEKDMDLNSEDSSNSDSNSEDESEDGCNNTMIPLNGPFNCTICELRTMNRIHFIEHIVEFHQDEIDKYDKREGGRLKLILAKYYEERRISVNYESTSEDEESQAKIDVEVPGLKLGGPTVVCSACHRRVYKSIIELHSLNCRNAESELNSGPLLLNKSIESEGINNNGTKNATFNGNSDTEEFENNKKLHNGDDTFQAASINDDHASTGIILKKTPNGWKSSLLPGKKSKKCVSKKINNRPNHYMTKPKRIEKKKRDKEAKKYKCKKAIEAWQRGEYKSVRTCAAKYEIPKSTLYLLIETGEEYRGSGAYSKRLTSEEEDKIVKHVSWRSSIGCGVSWYQLALLLQEIFLKIKEETPERITGFEHQNQMPNDSYVRRFAERHSLSLRKTNEISKGRQILTVEDLKNWQQETRNFFFGDNKQLSDALKDPRRIFNQDESAIEMGSTSQRVLAEKGTKVLFNVSSGSRDHLTASFIVNANGEIVPPRLVYKGKRNIAAKKLSNMDKTGRSGSWKFSVANKGYMTRELYCDCLRDLDEYLTKEEIDRPVAMFVDGATPHISQEAAALCKKFKIQPWLFKPNMTHILQPLDLTFFSSLKSTLKKTVWNWQCSPQNAGEQLNRYTIVPLLYEATEKCLENPDTVKNGFKRAGLFPWDESMPDKNKLLPGSIFSKAVQEDPEVCQPEKEVDQQDTEAGQKATIEDQKEKDNYDKDSVGSGGDRIGRSESKNVEAECYDKDMSYRLKTVPHFTMEERCTQLNKFEVVLLLAHQIKEFDMLRKQNIQSKDPLFLAWLSLKLATLKPESTAVAKVLSEKKVENIPSRKRRRNQILPTGAARYNPASDEWIEILEAQELKKTQKENKRPKIEAKNKNKRK